ncbi:uncharacterized protein N7511_008357 [Penicillium nucicola]|uniref:uncharacterized protein n=1 Tax=Penicillium nucicola TaxID=1850975 RepID=UPI0025456E33|nr:uncharacterized protein N7511_008357 [Penicillium nucicola]KAJ5751392.1 hypothetical protein N7511_008357 [Penicillium nucicola]
MSLPQTAIAMAKVEKWALQLKNNRKLSPNHKKRLLADIELLKGTRSGASKSMREKLKIYKDFLIKCVKEPGREIMVLCSLALGVSGICNLSQTYHQPDLLEYLIKMDLKNDNLSAMVQEYDVPTKDFFEDRPQDAEYRRQCGPSSHMTKYLQQLLEQVNINVELVFPFDPECDAHMTLKLDISQNAAWGTLPYFFQSDSEPSIVNCTSPENTPTWSPADTSIPIVGP